MFSKFMEIFMCFSDRETEHFPKTTSPKLISQVFMFVLAYTYTRKSSLSCCFVTHYLANMYVMYYFVQKCTSKFRLMFISKYKYAAEKMHLVFEVQCNESSSSLYGRHQYCTDHRESALLWQQKVTLSIIFFAFSGQTTLKNLSIQQ